MKDLGFRSTSLAPGLPPTALDAGSWTTARAGQKCLVKGLRSGSCPNRDQTAICQPTTYLASDLGFCS
jgi:hypothetical protein